jgi:hypothetical protein
MTYGVSDTEYHRLPMYQSQSYDAKTVLHLCMFEEFVGPLWLTFTSRRTSMTTLMPLRSDHPKIDYAIDLLIPDQYQRFSLPVGFIHLIRYFRHYDGIFAAFALFNSITGPYLE